MIERLFKTVRGLMNKSGSGDRGTSSESMRDSSAARDTGPSDPGDQVVLGDLADSDSYDNANAGVGRQKEPPGATGASTDEFDDAGYAGDPVDQDDVEDAAESGHDSNASRSDLDDTSGDDDTNFGDIPVRSGDLDEADVMHDAVGLHSTDDDTSELDEGLVDRSGVVDRSMEGDTDYVVSGYPSESIDDIDIKDTDDIGVYDADSVGDVDDDADFSDDTGNLGLADSETIDEESPFTKSGSSADASAFSAVSSEDVGVGVAAEVDDTSLIADSDDGADPSLQGATKDEPVGGNNPRGSGPAGAVRGDGANSCPADFPIKGNANSKIYHTPGRDSYDGTVPAWCFATEEDAVSAGYRAPKR